MFSIQLPEVTLLRICVAVVICNTTYFVVSNYKRFQHWKKQGIPELNPWLNHFRIVNLFKLRGTGVGELHLKYIREMGTIFGVTDLVRNNLMVADADALKDVLVRDFNHFLDRQTLVQIPIISKLLTQLNGQEWRRMRSIISPTFTSGKMKAMFPLMKKSLGNIIEVFEQNGSKEIDVFPVFGNFTMDTIAKVAFAVDCNTHKDPNHPFMVNAKKLLTPSWKELLVAIPLIISSMFLPIKVTAKLAVIFQNPGLTYLAKLAQKMIDERRRTGVKAQDYPDFLQLMLEAGRDGNDQNSTGTLTDEEIVANVVLILLAGYSTTMLTLNYATYSLAMNPDVQERARLEIREALKNSETGTLDYDVLSNLPYLEAVINETLRIYPPAFFTERQCSEDYILKANTSRLPHKDIIIKKGFGVFVPIWAIHHMEEYFPEPSKFNPERFLPENRDQLVPYTFLAFVAGPRNCVGMRLAMLELKLALATIISEYQIKNTPRTKIEFAHRPLALVPKEIVVSLEKIV